jgi:hypothetical protein
MDSRIVVCLVLVACGPKTVAVPTTAHPQPAVAKASPAPRPAATEPASRPEPEPPPPPKCEPKVADVPTALFGDRVLIRPPVNVELVEDNPTMATTYSTYVSTCDATVDRMSLFVFASDKTKPLATYLSEFVQTLDQSGYKGGIEAAISQRNDEILTSIEYPSANGQPAAKVLVAVTRKFENVLVVFYQTQPDQWDGLSGSFVASAKTLLVLPN